MARKGDIDSKSVASRLPMKLYIQLLQTSSSNKQTISSYLAKIIDEALNGVPSEPIIKEIKVEVEDPKQQKRINELIEEVAEVRKEKTLVVGQNEAFVEVIKKTIDNIELKVKYLQPSVKTIFDDDKEKLENRLKQYYGE